jgi:hypothetical protein
VTDADWERRGDEFDKRPVRTAAKWAAVVIAFVGVIAVALWGFGVFTSPIKGQGDAYQQKNSAQNWVNAQAQFHQDYESILAFDKKITDARRDLTDFEAKHPQIGNGTPFDPAAEQDSNLYRTLVGLTQQCQDTAAAYNARAQSYLSQDFRDASLPERISDNNCKPDPAASTTPTTH